MSVDQPYPELASVLSLALSAVIDAYRLTGDDNTQLIDAVERLGAEAMTEEYTPLKAIVTSMSDLTAGANTSSARRPDTGSFADRVAAIAAVLHRRSNEFASWLDGLPTPTAEARVAAKLLSQAASRSFRHAQNARVLSATTNSPGPDLVPPSGHRTETRSDDAAGAVAHRLALGICYDVAVEIMAVAVHRAIVLKEQDFSCSPDQTAIIPP